MTCFIQHTRSDFILLSERVESLCILFFLLPFFFFFSFNSSNSHELVQGSALCKQFFTLRMLLLKSRYCAKYHRSLLRFYTVCHHCSSYSIESHLGLWYSSQVFSGEKSACFFWFCFLFLIKNRKKKSPCCL